MHTHGGHRACMETEVATHWGKEMEPAAKHFCQDCSKAFPDLWKLRRHYTSNTHRFVAGCRARARYVVSNPESFPETSYSGEAEGRQDLQSPLPNSPDTVVPFSGFCIILNYTFSYMHACG